MAQLNRRNMLIKSALASGSAGVFAFSRLATTHLQDIDTQPDIDELTEKKLVRMELDGTKFHRAIARAAIRAARRSNEVTFREAAFLRGAMLLPLVRADIKDLVLLQMKASSAESLPVDANGDFDEAAIEWGDGSILAFLEKLIPILIMFLKIFQGG